MASSVLDAIRELLPVIRDRAGQTESQRQISPETMTALVDSGIFGMFRPRRHGGLESDPIDYFTAVRVLASACPSTGWAVSLLGATPWHVALLEPEAQDDVWGENRDALISSSYAPMGRLVPSEGGYRLNGTWRAAPAVGHCDWVMLGSLLIGQRGDPVDYVAVVVPRSDFSVTDDWDVVGLRGTGSSDVIVHDAFVPTHRTYGSAGRMRVADTARRPDVSALYRVPFASIHSTAICFPLLGAAEGAYNYHLERMRERSKLSYGGRKGTEDEFAQIAVARGTGEIDASLVTLERDLREQTEHATRNEPIPMELRLRARRDQVRAAERAVEAIDLLLKAASGHGVQGGTPIERAWRGIHTGAAHVINDVEQGMVLYGRWSYGLGVDDSLILV